MPWRRGRTRRRSSTALRSADLNYNGIGVASLTVHITDNDSPGVVVTESSGSTDVAEGGADDNYSVKLATQPTANVTVTLVSGAHATANPPSSSSRRPTGTSPRMWR